jgi:hypothetical protein
MKESPRDQRRRPPARPQAPDHDDRIRHPRALAATPDLDASLDNEWQAARNAGRMAATLHDFKEEAITQAAVHWLLMGVFIRFLEDNGLIDRPWLSAAEPGPAGAGAGPARKLLPPHPGDSDREYLLAAYRDVGRLPGLGPLFDERHNPLFRLAVSGDGAMAIVGFWQKIDPDTGTLLHDFSDPEWSTRFLGDLYQDLSEAAQKKFALLQTPEFVEEFILDRTLNPAIAEFGYREVRLIDPTCGSGTSCSAVSPACSNAGRRTNPAATRAMPCSRR